MPSAQQKRKVVVVVLIMLLCLTTFTVPIENTPWLGMRFFRALHNPRYLTGKGAPGFKRRKYRRANPVDVWKQIRTRGCDRQLHLLTRMTIPQFRSLLEDLSSLTFPTVGRDMTFGNKILCVFIWLVKYPQYSELATLFGVSVPVIGSLLSKYVSLFTHCCCESLHLLSLFLWCSNSDF